MNIEALKHALCKMMDKEIIRASYQATQLHGGTLGDVQLVEGMAQRPDGTECPYRLVLKTQKKWQRHGDPDSWRREYDLYMSDLGAAFCDSFRWPRCYHVEMIGIPPDGAIWARIWQALSQMRPTRNTWRRITAAV